MSHNKKSTQNKIVAELELVPVIYAICVKVGVARATLYRWFDEDPDFKARVDEAMDRGRTSINELAESKLIQKIDQGDRWGIRFWLESNNPRYIRPRRNFKPPEDPKGIEPIVIQFVGESGKYYDDYSSYAANEPED